MEIQHRARWTSTKQLKTYDLSNQEDSFKKQLAKRGLIKDQDYQKLFPETKTCPFCKHDKIGFAEESCPRCHHIVDRKRVQQKFKQDQAQIGKLHQFFSNEQMQQLFALSQVVEGLQQEVRALKKTRRGLS